MPLHQESFIETPWHVENKTYDPYWYIINDITHVRVKIGPVGQRGINNFTKAKERAHKKNKSIEKKSERAKESK